MYTQYDAEKTNAIREAYRKLPKKERENIDRVARMTRSKLSKARGFGVNGSIEFLGALGMFLCKKTTIDNP